MNLVMQCPSILQINVICNQTTDNLIARPLVGAVSQKMQHTESWQSDRLKTMQRSAQFGQNITVQGCDMSWPWNFRALKILADLKKQGRAPLSSSVCYFIYEPNPLKYICYSKI